MSVLPTVKVQDICTNVPYLFSQYAFCINSFFLTYKFAIKSYYLLFLYIVLTTNKETSHVINTICILFLRKVYIKLKHVCVFVFNIVIINYVKSNSFQGCYMTIHITPEPDFSYVSFETNMPQTSYKDVITRVLDIFRPANVVLTVFANKVSKWSCIVTYKSRLMKIN